MRALEYALSTDNGPKLRAGWALIAHHLDHVEGEVSTAELRAVVDGVLAPKTCTNLLGDAVALGWVSVRGSGERRWWRWTDQGRTVSASQAQAAARGRAR